MATFVIKLAARPAGNLVAQTAKPPKSFGAFGYQKNGTAREGVICLVGVDVYQQPKHTMMTK